MDECTENGKLFLTLSWQNIYHPGVFPSGAWLLHIQQSQNFPQIVLLNTASCVALPAFVRKGLLSCLVLFDDRVSSKGVSEMPFEWMSKWKPSILIPRKPYLFYITSNLRPDFKIPFFLVCWKLKKPANSSLCSPHIHANAIKTQIEKFLPFTDQEKALPFILIQYPSTEIVWLTGSMWYLHDTQCKVLNDK